MKFKDIIINFFINSCQKGYYKSQDNNCLGNFLIHFKKLKII